MPTDTIAVARVDVRGAAYGLGCMRYPRAARLRPVGNRG